MRIIGIVSGKGGVGKTTVSSNLAVALTQRGKRVLLVDFNPSTPHLNFHFGIFDYYFTINDVLSGSASVNEAIYSHWSGVDIIPGSLSIPYPQDLSKLYSIIKDIRNYDYVILDSSPGLGFEGLATIKSCDEVLIVANPDYPSLFDVLRLREVLNHNRVRITGLVLNVINKKNILKSSNVSDLTGLPLTILITNDDNIVRSLGENLPVMLYRKNSGSSKKFGELAAFLEGEEIKPKWVFGLKIFD